VRRAAGLLALLLLAPQSCPGRAPAAHPLVVDLSSHVVAISAGFAGTNLLLFGVAETDGDIVVVVRGPNQSELVRRRTRLLGLWVNRYQAVIGDAPAYYQIASTRPLGQIASASLLERYRLGTQYLGLTVARDDKGENDATYRQALLRIKQRTGLYGEQAGTVNLLGGRLFRTDVTFPANVPTGVYRAEVYLIKDGEIVSVQTTPLIISKTGVSAEIFDFAKRHAALYGLAAVAMAMLGGWIAAIAFRKG
jgi:uncharacterized protein (TIGR02186 family)